MCPLLSVRFYSLHLYSVFNEHFLLGSYPRKLRDSLSLVGTSGLEPPTSRLSGARSNHLSYAPLWLLVFSFPSVLTGGDDGIRTHDPLLAGQVLSQLSYTPIFFMRFSVTEN